MPPARFTHLDGMRGVAILLVLLWHYLVVPLQASPGSPLAYAAAALSFAWAGVDVFFVLSGFLIGRVLLAGNSIREFYVRRAFRIVPLYYLTLGLWVTGTLLETGSGVLARPASEWLLEGPLPWWPYFAFLQNFSMAEHHSFGSN